MTDCKHEEFYYYPATNEDGWQCSICRQKMPGEEPGFRPDLDRSHIDLKVGDILMDFHEANLIYISNGSHGDGLSAAVANRCRETGFYDQYSILQFILDFKAPSHAKFWREISEGVLTGNDKRDRCHCGKLATTYSNAGNFCNEHDRSWDEIKTGFGGTI